MRRYGLDRRNTLRSRRGFTLLEVLIVVAIIGVIAAMVVPRLLGQQQQAYIDITKGNIKSAETAIELYAKDDFGRFPKASGNEEVWVLLMKPRTKDGRQIPAVASEPFKDGWGHRLYYEWTSAENDSTGMGKPKLWSAGPDGENNNGSGDDINNWTVSEVE
ncbi:MAG: type II secretion system protein GspG [Planctomycetaceae bacterium]